jgi:hypothetical protein
VLVENRLCTTAIALASRSSHRSVKNAGSWLAVSIPLYTSVLADNDAKYTGLPASLLSRSARRRRQNASRSSSMPDSPPRPATSSIAKRGRQDRAVGPTPARSGSVGTSRQPSTVRPSSAASRCTRFTASARGPASTGRNAIPAA